jgi:hypothetical protein
MNSALIVDSDPGFLFWLGGMLGVLDAPCCPARSIQEALDRLESDGFVPELIIVNPALPGAAEFVHEMRGTRGHLPIIAAIEPAAEMRSGLDRYDVVQSKPAVPDEKAASQWMEVIRRALAGTPVQPTE